MTRSRRNHFRPGLAPLALLAATGLALILIIGMAVHARTEIDPVSAATTNAVPNRAEERLRQSRAPAEPILMPLFLPPR